MLTRLHQTLARLGTSPRRPARPNRRTLNLTLESLESRAYMHGEAINFSPTPAIAETGGADAVWVPNVVARIVNGTPTSDFAAVGMVGDRTEFGSGTLIAPRYVLTAGHCGEGLANTAGRFVIGGKTYSTSRVIVHPQYNSNTLDNDLSIFELSTPVTGVTPSPIFRGTPVVGQLLTLVGYGGGGTGTSGTNGDFGIKRVGTTPIDEVDATVISWNFDNNRESNTAPGDSGGPAYVKVNNVYYIAGVTSGGDKDDAGIGDHSFDTRVDAFKTWIDSIVGGTTPPGGGTGGDDHANAPGSTATKIALTSGHGAGSGKLETAGDRDVFQFTAAKTGVATITLTGQGGLDTYLRVYDSTGKQIAENDDFGSGTNSQAKVNVKSGTYYVSAGAYQDDATGSYSVSVTVVDGTSNRFANPTHVTLRSSGSSSAKGVIASAGSQSVFDVVATRAGTMTINAKRTSGPLDTVLSVYDASGNLIVSNDDYGSSHNSRVTLSVQTGQKYYVVVEGNDSTTGKFKLTFATAAATRSIRHEAGPNVSSYLSGGQYVAAVDDLMSGLVCDGRNRRLRF